MQRLFAFATLVAMVASGSPASAHFVWLNSKPTDKGTEVMLVFGETSEPGEEHLLDKVKQTKTWLVKGDGTTVPLTLAKQAKDAVGSWNTTIEGKSPLRIEADCDYGVLSRGGKPFLLQYHARRLVLDSAQDLEKLGKAARLPLDVSTRLDGKDLVFEIIYDGKPAKSAELVIQTPDNSEKELKPDDAGIVRLPAAAAGHYEVRASIILPNAGKRGEKAFDETRHYTTVTFKLPGEGKAAVTANAPGEKPLPEKADPEATALLQKARETRAVWKDFRGFKAKINVQLDGVSEKGTVEVDENGSAVVTLNDKAARIWAEEQIGSLVQHRLPSSFGDEKAVFIDKDDSHPLGRLIRLGDARFDSYYRIKNNAVNEVNRKAGKVRFTISVLEEIRNDEGKSLPRVINVTTWDNASNMVLGSVTLLNTWKKAGQLDVPEKLVEVSVGPNSKKARQVVFEDYELLGNKK